MLWHEWHDFAQPEHSKLLLFCWCGPTGLTLVRIGQYENNVFYEQNSMYSTNRKPDYWCYVSDPGK